MRPSYYLLVCLAIAVSFTLGMVVEAARASRGDKDETRVTGIGGLFFKSREPQKLADWYHQHLGIAFVSGGSGPNAPAFHVFEWIEKGDVAKPGATVLAIFPDGSKYLGASKARFMINFRVANLDRTLAELKSAGATVDDKVNAEDNGRFGWATDPDGNRIELWEPNGK